MSARTGRRTDPKRAAQVGSVPAHVLDQLLLELEETLRASVQAPPGFGRLDPPARAVDETLAKARLEGANLQADSGLRHPEALGGLGEATPLDDRAKRSELARIHKESLSRQKGRLT